MNARELQLWTTDIAHKAGEVLLSHRGGALTRKIKSHAQDFATEADVAAEELITRAIAAQFPDDDILAEESGFTGSHRAAYTWIIDPLDGTWNFAEGRSAFGAMIARVHGDDVELAAVDNPAEGDRAYAVRGEGAYLNGLRLELQHPRELRECVASIGWLSTAPGAQRVSQLRDQLDALGMQTKSLRSTSGNTMSILRGERNIYIGNALFAWDFAPMDLLLREAGFRVTDFEGQPLSWKRGDQDFIAAPSHLHEQIMLYCNR
jgi:myo-inositol-1(or 4)-monophosphatase